MEKDMSKSKENINEKETELDLFQTQQRLKRWSRVGPLAVLFAETIMILGAMAQNPSKLSIVLPSRVYLIVNPVIIAFALNECFW